MTLTVLVLAGQANVYVLSERGSFWNARTAAIMLFASAAEVAVVGPLAVDGLLVALLPPASSVCCS
jgi:hypothetical protein